MKRFVILIINFYQISLSFDGGLLSFLAPTGACKYEISCSEYTKRAILEFGVLKGSFLGFKRLITCR